MKYQKVSFFALLCSLYAQNCVADVEKENEPLVFTPTDVKGRVVEQFLGDWTERWTPSHAKRVVNGIEEMAYNGEWAVEESKSPGAVSGELGLVMKDAAAHHAISYEFDEPVDEPQKDLVVQYEVNAQDGLNCGGAYLKLLAERPNGEMSNTVPYRVMFGPDKCGINDRVHFIFKHENPISHVSSEKHLDSKPASLIRPGITNLYTLVVHPDQTYEVRVNGDIIRSGSLFTDFLPPVLPPLEVYDPEDIKPQDWVDEAEIPDVNAVKPDDWDEDAPRMIPDPDALQPEDWLSDEPFYIPDPKAVKPEDWNDEEDGDWVAPEIANPKCLEVSGCGEWKAPLIPNPNFRGPWTPPMIPNPDYIGEWIPRKIPNPNYFDDEHPSHFGPIYGIGFELWTMQPNIRFSNIYFGHSIEDAERLGNETFVPKSNIEQSLLVKRRTEKKPSMHVDEEEGKIAALFLQTYEKVKAKLPPSVVATLDPYVTTLLQSSEMTIAAVSVLFSILAVLITCLYYLTSSSSSSSSSPAPLSAGVTEAEKEQQEIFRREEINDNIDVSYAPELESTPKSEDINVNA
ncbi:calnexin Cnx1 [Schizosaccharomyces octosporus yFS286]|uniref:Calnexin Cnx1 n=1 Tax=Schizosaccharomyces octosporus (strain yFS286) TaxID=483514 RepID=S9PMW1_SCHOY|nr:calnexin Cnx1 [Schizosaccharomyces octosporus yFS286]EPX70576.1 calnexin Cnx1 [Schizosaccharomyces octosporus yFS286]